MTEQIRRFLESTDEAELWELGRALQAKGDPADVVALVRALGDSLEARRLNAVYALGFRRDHRAVRPLIACLANPLESVLVRGQAAEVLGKLRRRKAVACLIEGSRDPSADVRFWCVFALGSFLQRRRRRRVALALIDRLADCAEPERTRGYWPIRLEALAMLGRARPRIRPYDAMFYAERERIVTSAESAPAGKSWAAFYAD